MRPLPPPTQPQSNLLSGWDDFEALFAAGPKPPAQPTAGTAPAGSAVSTGAFGSMILPPPPPAAAAPSLPAAAAAAGAPSAAAGAPRVLKKSGSVKELAPAASQKAVEEGLTALQAGQWDKAATQFGKAVDQGASGGGDFARQALQLFVAARLLAAAAGALRKQPGTAARLARFAVALPLLEQEPAQRVAAVGFAVEANMAAKNYG